MAFNHETKFTCTNLTNTFKEQYKLGPFVADGTIRVGDLEQSDYPLIHAFDIDYPGMKFKNQDIDSTGDLIHKIEIAIDNGSGDSSTYSTYSQYLYNGNTTTPVKTSKGSYIQPVYFSEGIPIVGCTIPTYTYLSSKYLTCDSTLNANKITCGTLPNEIINWSDGSSNLNWGAYTTVGTIAGHNISVIMPENPLKNGIKKMYNDTPTSTAVIGVEYDSTCNKITYSYANIQVINTTYSTYSSYLLNAMLSDPTLASLGDRNTVVYFKNGMPIQGNSVVSYAYFNSALAWTHITA